METNKYGHKKILAAKISFTTTTKFDIQQTMSCSVFIYICIFPFIGLSL